jgi:hypothetical protein
MISTMRFCILVLAVLSSLAADAQALQRRETFAELSLAGGSYRGSVSLPFIHQWRLGVNRKFGVGIGLRATGFLGANLNYITAPSKITSGSTSPLILFKENIEANLDTLLIQSPQANFVNVMINLDYKVSQKFMVGFSIDAVGYSFGATQRSNFMSNNRGRIIDANPTKFNILLISDNDRGSLNSELYLKYLVNDKWSLKAAGQFLFTEYTTVEPVQEFPEKNDRFRNKALLFGVGITRKF